MAPRTTPPGARAGLTLVEVVVAAGVLAILLLGLVSTLAHGMRMDALSRERAAAARRALEVLEARVMAAGTDEAFDAIQDLTEPFEVALPTKDGRAYALPPAEVDPLPDGLAGQLVVTADLDGDGSVTDDVGYYGGRPNLLRATARVRWRSAYASTSTAPGAQDVELVLTSMKVRYVP